LVNIAAAAGLSPLVSSARRSHAQQALLYRRFLAGQSRFPAAPPGASAHELGLAFDLWVNDESQLTDLGTVWEQMGGVWGGHFHDPIHFEAGGSPKRRTTLPTPGTVDQGESLAGMGVDLLLGMNKGVGSMELAGALLPKGSNPYYEELRKSMASPSYAFTQSWNDMVRLYQKLF